MLTFNVFHVGEQLIPEEEHLASTSVAETALTTSGEQYVQEAVEELQPQVHQAAGTGNQDKIRFQTVCSADIILCTKVVFEGTFTDKDMYLYLGNILRIVKFIDKYLTTAQKVTDTLDKIAINNEVGKRRWYATRDTILINLGAVKNKTEFLELMTHELGHILDLGMLQGESKQKNKIYTEFGKVVFATDDISLQFYALSRDSETIRKSTAVQKDFCSGYGMSDPFEDFSECVNLYVHHNALFQKFAAKNKMLMQKYNFLAALFSDKYLSDGKDTMSDTTRPRDTTKIN